MDVPFPLDIPLPFYGVDNERFKLGDVVYEVLDDPDDGYRSYLKSVVVTDGAGIFFPNPVATVRAVPLETWKAYEYADGNFDGFALVDDAGHRWLVFGTNTDDQYYPSFEFHYFPPVGR